MLPRDFPPRSTVYGYFRTWITAGVWAHVHDVLYRRSRDLEGREESPTAAIIDSQSVMTGAEARERVAADERQEGDDAADQEVLLKRQRDVELQEDRQLGEPPCPRPARGACRPLCPVAELHPLGAGVFDAAGFQMDLFSSLSFALGQSLGILGLPHLLIRFFTVPDEAAARKSVVVAVWIIGGVFPSLPAKDRCGGPPCARHPRQGRSSREAAWHSGASRRDGSARRAAGAGDAARPKVRLGDGAPDWVRLVVLAIAASLPSACGRIASESTSVAACPPAELDLLPHWSATATVRGGLGQTATATPALWS